MRTQTTRSIGGRVNADGTPASAGPFSSRRTAAGTYAITLPATRLLAATASSSAGGTPLALPYGFAENSFTVSTYTTGITLTDGSFTFTAVVAA